MAIKTISINSKGQAALTDTLYFLLIVTGLCVFMFTFSASYGENISTHISDQYLLDFSSSALKTILYSSTTREYDADLYDPNSEKDHVLVLLKESYAAHANSPDEVLDCDAALALADNIRGIMAPVSDAYDYIFYVYNTRNQEVLFAFVHIVDERSSAVSVVGIPAEEIEGKGFVGVEVTAAPHTDRFCWPTLGTIQELMFNVSRVSRSSGQLLILVPNVAHGEINAKAEFIMWPTTSICPPAGDRCFYNPGPGPIPSVEGEPWSCEDYEEISNRAEIAAVGVPPESCTTPLAGSP